MERSLIRDFRGHTNINAMPHKGVAALYLSSFKTVTYDYFCVLHLLEVVLKAQGKLTYQEVHTIVKKTSDLGLMGYSCESWLCFQFCDLKEAASLFKPQVSHLQNERIDLEDLSSSSKSMIQLFSYVKYSPQQSPWTSIKPRTSNRLSNQPRRLLSSDWFHFPFL